MPGLIAIICWKTYSLVTLSSLAWSVFGTLSRGNHATFSPDDRQGSNIDSLIDFFAILNLELNGCITKKDILFTLLNANVLDFEFIFKNLCATCLNSMEPSQFSKYKLSKMPILPTRWLVTSFRFQWNGAENLRQIAKFLRNFSRDFHNIHVQYYTRNSLNKINTCFSLPKLWKCLFQNCVNCCENLRLS